MGQGTCDAHSVSRRRKRAGDTRVLTGPVGYRAGGGNSVLGRVCFCALLCPRTASRPLWGGNPTCEPELFSQRQSCTKVLELPKASGTPQISRSF